MALDTKNSPNETPQKTGSGTTYAPTSLLKSEWLPFGEMLPDLAASKPVVPKADPVPNTSRTKADNLAASRQVLRQEEDEIDIERRTSIFNSTGQLSEKQLEEEQDEADANKAKTPAQDDGNDDEEQSDDKLFLPGDAALVVAAAAATHHHRRFHLLHDLRMFMRMRKAERALRGAEKARRDAKKAEEKAKEAERKAKEAKEKEEARKAGKTGEETENPEKLEALKKAEQAAKDAEKERIRLTKDVERLKRIATAARADVRFARLYSVVSVAAKGGLAAALIMRGLEGAAAYATAGPNESRADALTDAFNTVTRSPFSKKATAEFNQGKVGQAAVTVADDIWHGAVDTVKFFAGAVAHPIETFEAARDDTKALVAEGKWLWNLYEKDPEKARVFAQNSLKDMGIIYGTSQTDLAAAAHDYLVNGKKPALTDGNVRKIVNTAETTALNDPKLVNAATGLVNTGLSMPPPPSRSAASRGILVPESAPEFATPTRSSVTPATPEIAPHEG